ncbi:protein kinase RIO3 [Seminavis robusta]|uniref:non-specific serine/threonine protein kinase n=1 Tax=Seminavis robusta TaxID=568900 RepID=A0A9N8E5L2_9STRA|nr:protein kinase RIO3 [Seminavis robusta]|eukprot:Sro695_g188800.1 protein kinase RIO3 (687) ;mRNA; r:48565-50701
MADSPQVEESEKAEGSVPRESASSPVAPDPAPRKTWAMPKAPPKVEGTDPAKKKSLLEIMEEERNKEQETKVTEQRKFVQRLEQEEEAALLKAMQASMATGESGQEDDMDEDLKMALMISMQDQAQSHGKMPPSTPSAAVAYFPATAQVPPAAAAAAAVSNDGGLTEEEMKEIERALQDADAAENSTVDAASLKLALELQSEEDGKIRAAQKRPAHQGNVRTMNRDEFLREQGKGADDDYHYDYDEDEEDDYDYDASEAGFRINSTKQSPWSRADGATIRGPNQELRTKHDLKLQGQANAQRLDVRADDETGNRAHVGNKAYNAFHRSMQKKTVKGVAAHGHGRATADTDKTRDGALDGRVRLQIARAVNNGLIETFHGCVKEGKEALVFHADQGITSEGFDVAVKVFKRISEFKNRGEYVAFDPRYGDGQDFRHAGQRQQLEIWAEKEHRNLIRAYRSHVPVPKPLWQKENVLFLRFLGEDGWPAPQLRELDIKKGSKKWTALYEQTMEAMQLLHCDAKLVHGDLSEYNIMVVPKRFLKRAAGEAVPDEGDEDTKPTADADEQKPAAETKGDQKVAAAGPKDDNTNPEPATLEVSEATNAETETPKPAPAEDSSKPAAVKPDDDNSLHVALIDFGQAVDTRHPGAEELLKRDVTRVHDFFVKMGITTTSVEAALAYVQTKGATLR